MPPKAQNVPIAQLDERLNAILTLKLAPLEEENAKLRAENAALRDTNVLLIKKIDKLISIIEKSEPVEIVPPQLSQLPSVAPESPPSDELAPNLSSTTLILSDSIYRHVLSSCPKVPGKKSAITDNITIGSHKIRKIIVPGACADRLWAEACAIPASDRNSITNLVISVGANYVDATSKENASDEITAFLAALGDLFPYAQLAWSVILPQPHQMTGIRYVNHNVAEYCHDNNIDLIWNGNFSVTENDGRYVRNLFTHDGVHLNRKGIDILTKTVREYLLSLYKY